MTSKDFCEAIVEMAEAHNLIAFNKNEITSAFPEFNELSDEVREMLQDAYVEMIEKEEMVYFVNISWPVMRDASYLIDKD